MKLFEAVNVSVEFDSATNLMVHRWSEKTASMSFQTFKEEMLQIKEAVKNHKPASIMVQAQKMGFITSPEVQEWIDSEISPSFLENGVTKFAYIMPTDIFQQVAIEQMMDEKNSKNFGTRFFDNEEEGYKWLVSN